MIKVEIVDIRPYQSEVQSKHYIQLKPRPGLNREEPYL